MEQLFNLSVETYRLILLIVCVIIIGVVNRYISSKILSKRQRYYRNVYLKSDAWKRKRYVVLKRDNWTCVRCGARATQVHRAVPKHFLKHGV